MPQRFADARLSIAANDHARRPVNAPADAPRNRPLEARTPVGQRGAPGWPHKPLYDLSYVFSQVLLTILLPFFKSVRNIKKGNSYRGLWRGPARSAPRGGARMHGPGAVSARKRYGRALGSSEVRRPIRGEQVGALLRRQHARVPVGRVRQRRDDVPARGVHPPRAPRDRAQQCRAGIECHEPALIPLTCVKDIIVDVLGQRPAQAVACYSVVTQHCFELSGVGLSALPAGCILEPAEGQVTVRLGVVVACTASEGDQVATSFRRSAIHCNLWRR